MPGIPTATLDRVLELATRAPSVHNSQPWRWRATGSRLELRADTTRQLMATDPNGRDLTISCGAAVRTLQLAAAAAGWPATVDRLPDPLDPNLLAAFSFRRAPVTPEAEELAEAVVRRRTDRRMAASWPIPPERVAQYGGLATRFGTLLTDLTAAGHDETVQQAVVHAERVQGRHGRYHDELWAWSGQNASLGVPAQNRLSRAAAGRQVPVPSRFPAGTLEDPAPEADPEHRWLVVSTSSDDRLSWLRTGEALQAIWLRTTLEGIALVPFSQPIEVDHTREQLRRTCLDDTSCPQLLLRVGWMPAGGEEVPPTPREAARLERVP